MTALLLAVAVAVAIPVKNLTSDDGLRKVDSDLTTLYELPPLPDLLESQADDCPQAWDLVPGQPFPPGLVDEAGLVRCRAVAVPSAELLDLVAVDIWSEHALARHHLVVTSLRRDVGLLQVDLAAAMAPLPWWERPQAQRWAGRLEVAAVVAVGLWASSQWSRPVDL